MASGLTGKRIVIAGTRKTDEISTLIEKQGGTPILRPLQGTVFLAEQEIEPDLRGFVENGADWVIFTTGTGFETLLDMAEKLGVRALFEERIRQAKAAARGYKTHSALKKLGILPVAVDDDGTTRGLIRALESFDFEGKRVMIQLHGETAPVLIRFFEERGANVTLLLPYQHVAPDTKAVETLCRELMDSLVDAVCFTTAAQVRFLFEFASQQGYATKLKSAFDHSVLAVAVGKITREALEEEGIQRVLAPELERMGAMIVELSRYYADK
ncbi:uroporphyrinogen-III synthase [Aneurinibacillus sp. Ricciae_BoGa-3]|uniref:uroporphyrinogen-III synthase n=1 Tax=Aneurinibacillus sp. Ricciae_BoGa-3 TaxID=3022697 RepID=UPI00233F91EA|nr:uroporphyrinogen-III synthase [Aneurinibacillus sp. Ricciae_BoGa-3]WCK56618.1 uroporphyrinogen-III synthase [Aneurinibacillus sp. Ricciae_BoGa-3]